MVDIAQRPSGSSGILAALNNRHVRGTVVQALLLTAVVGAFLYFTSNAISNMGRLGITSGYGFLDRPANFGIGEFMVPYTPADTYGRAIFVGLLNTIKVALVGCILATILGIFLGILRLTNNPLLSTLIQSYIEVIRNVPLLLQLFFWYAVAQKFPGPRDAFQPLPGFFLSNRGVKVPWLEWAPQHDIMLLAAVIGVVISFFVRKASDRKRDATGVGFMVFPWAIGLIFGIPAIIGMMIGAPMTLSVPVLRGFNFAGGVSLSPEFFALLIGLTLYTAAFIAEIVRSGIQSVGKGQGEAARALGLPAGKIMRLVTLPQALRVIIPPMTSNYLNLTKNSSLAVAIGYPDVVSIVNTTMNQTGQSFETIAILMGVYLTLSLSISAFMNWYNSRISLKER